MARQKRPPTPQTCLHIWNRGVRRTALFLDDDDQRRFLELADQYFSKYGIELYAFCLVGNHYHFVVFDPDGRISEAMRDFTSRYARYFNDRYALVGPLFQGRFKSRPIADDADLLSASRYVHRNSLDIAANAPMDEYRWSSYRAYVTGARPAAVTDTSLVLGVAGGRDAYRRFVESRQPDDARQAPHSGTLPPLIDQSEQELDRIDRTVALHFPDHNPIFDKSVRGTRNHARTVAVLLAAEEGDVSPATLARRYGYDEVKNLHSALRKLRRIEAENPHFGSMVTAIRRSLAA